MARPRTRVLLRAGALLALIVLTAACGMIPPEPHTVQAKEVFWLYNVILVMGAIVFVGVEGFIVYSIVRYRRRDDRLPTQVHGNNLVELVWTAIPTVIVLILFVLSTFTLNSISARSDDPGVTIDVDGKQFYWIFHYRDSDADPANDVTITGSIREPAVMGLPIGEPVRLILHSDNVIHSFFVPSFLVKLDAVPTGDRPPNEMEFTVSEAGTYSGQCAEFCGNLHALMTFSVQAMPRPEFDAWLAAIRAGETPAPSVPAGGEVLKLSATNSTFSTHELEATAGEPFTIEFTNEALEHNVSIYKDGEPVFEGAYFTGPGTIKYAIEALPAGEYTFICDIHPVAAMTGTLTVK
ncbi:MAG: cytochrome c oxidase subunit II [Chloroflexota bacterium]|nr:cytochrome c oxidase subunit II [Chloroflexota bacterium]